METKFCNKCEEEKPVASFSKRSRSNDGLQNQCKQCKSAYYGENKERQNANTKAWYQENKERHRELTSRRYQDNKESESAKRKARYQQNKDKENATNNAWYEANRDKKLAKGREWYSNNKALVNASTTKRRLAKLQRTPPWADMSAIAEFYVEAKRLEELTGIQFHVDHIVPLQGELVSGLHVPANLQLLPAHENLSKSNSFEVAA